MLFYLDSLSNLQERFTNTASLQQALYNIVENAIKYVPESGDVTIHLQTSPSTLTFTVHDSGIGILKGDMPRLFEKFYRGTNREALAQRGTGLGLAIVKSIAERHGGKVWAESDLDNNKLHKTYSFNSLCT